MSDFAKAEEKQAEGKTINDYYKLLYPNLFQSDSLCTVKIPDVPANYKRFETVTHELLVILNREWEHHLPKKWNTVHRTLTNWRNCVHLVFHAIVKGETEKAKYQLTFGLKEKLKGSFWKKAFPTDDRLPQQKRALYWHKKFMQEVARSFHVEQ